MSLPDSFVVRGQKLAEGMLLFGNPVDSLTREELIAALANMCDSERSQREEHARQLNFIREFR